MAFLPNSMEGNERFHQAVYRMSHPTEFAFVLPRGYVDAEGNLHRAGAMRLATAADEITPMQDARVRTNRNYLVVLLLSRVITRLGVMPREEITPAVIEQLFAADIAYLQEFYRRINDSGSAEVEACCPTCGSPFYVDLSGGGSRQAEATSR